MIALGLPTLLLEGFDSDQIWAELELYNEPALKYFDEYAASLTKTPEPAEVANLLHLVRTSNYALY